jgi:hypothetical protein
MRIGLISCCKEKLNHPAPARELYVSDYFKKCMTWISKPGRVDGWGILSAKHGLVMPDQVIEPYDLCLADLPKLKQQRWADWIHEQLTDQWGDSVIYTILAGYEYRRAVSQMPAVEDVIDHWTRMRAHTMGNTRARMGIGVIKKYLKEDRPYGC